ncbi:MAG: iron-containing alcohol dehydrogenase [Thermoplasmata archaeon]|nr:iron-containing alcohol dehydrogenase [Thermoplasmata archaeon]
MMGFLTVPRLAFGAGALEQLSALGARRALVIVDPNVARLGKERRAIEELQKTDTTLELWAGPPVDPSTEDLAPGVALATSLQPDWILAVGGGSTIDAAKGVWVRYERLELSLDGLTPLIELGLRRKARFVAVPTTSGSGAEASWTATFRREGGLPVEVASRELVPDWALLDPSLAWTMPPEVTADSGAQVLAHAFEAIASEWSHPFSDALAREALVAALTHLPRVAKHPDDEEARSAVHYAATMAGVAISNSQVGVAHALATALASEFRIPRGRLLGVLLPFVLEYNFPAARDRYGTLAPLLGSGAVQHRAALPDRIRPVLQQLGIPPTLEAAGISASHLVPLLPLLAERASKSPGAVSNPRVPSLEELTGLLELALRGGHVHF